MLPTKVFSLGTENESVVWEVEGDTRAAVKKIFEELGGVSTLLPKGAANSTVILKPNLCLPDNDNKATTTSSALVGEICRYLSEQGVLKIIVTDHTLQGANLFDTQPLVTEIQKYPAAKILLANDQRYYIPTEVKGKVLTSVEILKILPKADLLINLPTAKHHTATQVSLGIKNLMGLIWDRSAFHTELDLNQAIGDLALAIKPDITIIDASRVLLKGGPTGPGPISNDNRIFVSRDIVAVDSIVASRYSFGGKSLSAINIAHIKAAYENGIGEIDINKIELKKIVVE
jgi:uncharacterized protein (DUF362 family)